MNISKFQIAIILLLSLVAIFIGVPIIASSGIGDSIEDHFQPDIADPTEEFGSIENVQRASITGQFRSENVYQTTYVQNIESCNTYTLQGEMELVEEGNGLSEPTAQLTLETNEPTAITCIVTESAREEEDNREYILVILDYNTENGEYMRVDSVQEIRDRQDSGFLGIF